MKQLQVPFIGEDTVLNGLIDVSVLLSKQESHFIDNLLWSDNGYRPAVKFYIAHTASGLLLKYVVEEQYVKADYHRANDPVYEDSCVEAFIRFGNDPCYYNFEFNCIGTALVGYGNGRHARKAIKKDLVENITNFYTINDPDSTGADLYKWQIAIHVPFSVFEFHDINTLKNTVCHMNFYKCGDDLPEPHFLSWNFIDNPSPNFHLPEFFGKVQFMP